MGKWSLHFTMCCILWAIVVGCSTDHPSSEKSSKIVARAGEVSITEKQLQIFMMDHRSQAARYFRERHQAVYTADFWNTSFDGLTPLEYARQLALDEIRQLLGKLSLAREAGITDHVSLQDILDEQLGKQKKSPQGRIQFGARNMDERNYIYHAVSVLEAKLKRQLRQSSTTIDRERLHDLYEQRQDLNRVKSVRLQGLFFPKRNEDAMRIAKKALEALRSGQTFTEVRNSYLDRTDPNYNQFTVALDDYKQAYGREFLFGIFGLDIGETTDEIVETEDGYLLAHCIGKRVERISFEELIPELEDEYWNRQYAKVTRERIRTMKLHIEKEAYRKVLFPI